MGFIKKIDIILDRGLLWMEYLWRIIGYLIGFGAIIFCVLASAGIETKYKTFTQDYKMDLIIILVSFSSIMLCSLFILVATRKFKELNQLIEENKNL